MTHVRYCYCEAEVRCSSVRVVYVVRLRIILSKAALQKRGSTESIEPPLDPPLLGSLPWCIELRQRCQECSPICILKEETDLIKEEVEPSKKKFPFGNVSYWYSVSKMG